MNVRESYDHVAHDYAMRFQGELAHKPFDREMLERFAVRARAVPGASLLPVLDLGCGPGHITRFLHDLGVGVTGVDISPGMLTEARRCHPTVAFQEGDMRALSLPDASVAAIAAPYSIIHIPRQDVVDVLRGLHRVIVPQGWLYLSFHVGDDVVHLDDLLGNPVELDFIFFRAAEMEEYLRGAGFANLETFERDPYPDVEAQTRRAYIFAQR
jgi:ubiquinone/menaquinone biosynthesis C-methylase UbiE